MRENNERTTAASLWPVSFSFFLKKRERTSRLVRLSLASCSFGLCKCRQIKSQPSACHSFTLSVAVSCLNDADSPERNLCVTGTVHWHPHCNECTLLFYSVSPLEGITFCRITYLISTATLLCSLRTTV